MARSQLKSIYLASSLKELNSKAVGIKLPNLESNIKSLTQSCSTADKLLGEAKLKLGDGDEELSYIYFMRFLEFTEKILKSPNYKKYKVELNKKLSDKQFKYAIEKAEELSTSLEKRYQMLDESLAIENKEKLKFSNQQNGPLSIGVKNVPDKKITVTDQVSEDPVLDEPKISLTSTELYELLQNKKSEVLLIEVRVSEEYDDIHFQHPLCINVPCDILKPGMTAEKVSSLLPEESVPLWKKRDHFEYIVLIDNYSYEKDVNLGNPLSIVKEAIWKWDVHTKLKRMPQILDGGLREWALHYPMLLTKAIPFDEIKKLTMAPDEKSSNINKYNYDYPNFDDAILESPSSNSSASDPSNANSMPSFDRAKKPAPNMSNGGPHHARQNSNPDLFPIKNGSLNSYDSTSETELNNSKPTPSKLNSAFYKEKVDVNDLSNFAMTKDVPVNPLRKVSNTEKPMFDRSAKPKNVVVNKKWEEEVLNNIHEEVNLHNKSVSLLQEQKDKEEEILRLRKNSEAEAGMRESMQEQETKLLQRLDSLEKEKSDLDIKLKSFQEENEKNKLELEKQTKDRELLEEELFKIKTAASREKKLKDDVNRLREERKKKDLEEKKKREFEEKKKREQEEKQRKEKELEEIKKRELEEKSSAAPISKVPASGAGDINLSNTMGSREFSARLNDSSTRSSSFSRGLSRSSSSPNIAQLCDDESINEQPFYDRKLKPSHLADSSTNLSRKSQFTFARNLSPVYGSQGNNLTGLKNLGNTCFMNCIIQCLARTMPLAAFFANEEHSAIIQNNRRNCNIASKLAEIIITLYFGQYKYVSPHDFKNVVSRYLSTCVGSEQQDAHEFLVTLLEKVHEELNLQPSPNRNVKPPDVDDKPMYQGINMFWDYHTKLNRSIIVDLFEGLLGSVLCCSVCSHRSYNYEVFQCLPLPITSSRCSLSDCFRNFLKEENLSDEAKWACPKCKVKREASKQMKICRLPNMLIIHLKRFSFQGMWRQKLQTTVDFPFILDMQPYVDKNYNYSKTYQLYGVANHYGTLEGGHYTAFCKSNNNTWYKFDDHEVYQIPSDSVKTNAAYVLFYTSEQ